MIGPNERIVAILGGGDWSDASVDHVIVPSGSDLDALHKQYDRWYRGDYLPALRRGEKSGFATFPDWLVKTGHASSADASEVEVWER